MRRNDTVITKMSKQILNKFYQNRFMNESVRKNFLKFSERRKDGKTERVFL